MREEEHQHEYKTLYTKPGCAAGMVCGLCGCAMSQDEVEEAFGMMLRAVYRRLKSLPNDSPPATLVKDGGGVKTRRGVPLRTLSRH